MLQMHGNALTNLNLAECEQLTRQVIFVHHPTHSRIEVFVTGMLCGCRRLPPTAVPQLVANEGYNGRGYARLLAIECPPWKQ